MNSKKAKTFKALSMIGSIVIFAIIAYLVVTNFDNPEKIYRIGAIAMIALAVILIIVGLIYNSINSKRTKTKYEEKRFKFLDVFYYHKYDNRLEHTTFDYYYVVKDLKDNKIYAIPQRQTNSQTEVGLDGKVTIFKGQGIRSNWQRVEFEEEGSLWVKKELSEFFQKNGKEIKFAYSEKLIYYKDQDENPEHKIGDLFKKNTYILYNANPEYGIELLENATFISGLLEFDINKK
jgi:hypothetical protein